ncbi:MAG: NmrA family protein [Chitinophagia bacterium]|jgi:hypothetical protein|nr:NmrA family protein [Chitinophagia bacterium]
MKKIIVIAGATGNLGGKIVTSLLAKGAEVRAIVRKETDPKKVKALEEKGVIVLETDMSNKSKLALHFEGAHCFVSALSGLEDTIIHTQRILLDAAIEAKVERFIPSDYSSDFTNLVEGQNRNLDFRRRFHELIDTTQIKATTIFNGPFMDLLTTDMPLILFKQKKILCWGDANQKLEFTTTYNVAEFTAEVAIDNETPRYLRIAGDVLSCNEFVELMTSLTSQKHKLLRPGGIKLLNTLIKVIRFFSPSESELYPAWQGMQYMRDLMEGRIQIQNHDNNRYPNIQWTTVKDFLVSENAV